MQRREFVSLLGGAAVSWPLPLMAQQVGKPSRIGVLGGSPTNPIIAAASRGFLDELRKLGFSAGRNLIVEQQTTEEDLPALSAQAAEMVRANANVLVAAGPENALKAALAASRTVPIVIVAINYDPIALGYVTSLAHPGGSVTGVFMRQTELAEKQVELLTHAFPEKTRLAVLWDSDSADQFAAAERRAKLLRLEVRSLQMENPPYDFKAAFRTLADAGAQMLLVLSSPFFGRQREQIADLSIRHRLPAMFIFRGYVEAGGLMSYGADAEAMYRQAGRYVAKILRGAKPVDLPVEQPTKFDFVVNLKTARAMGIELPTAILLRADEVIE